MGARQTSRRLILKGGGQAFRRSAPPDWKTQLRCSTALVPLERMLVPAMLAGGLLGSVSALANPLGGQVVGGTATISQPSTTQTIINQSSQSTIINWQSFNIPQGSQVDFNQPNSSSVALNRDLSNNASTIAGQLNANGQVWIVNPNGVAITPTAQVNVGGLVATTSNISNSNFLAGIYKFDQPGKPGASVVNQGHITVSQAGLADLVAPSVANSGVIQAKLGKVNLASGSEYTVDMYGDGMIKFAVSDQTAAAITGTRVSNTGTINAPGGTVTLSVSEAENIVDNSINAGGTITAHSLGSRTGSITVDSNGGTTLVSGTLDASGTGAGQSGGTVKVLGGQVGLTSTAKIDVSGDAGGGNVAIGGDFHGAGPDANATNTVVQQGATIDADALTKGNGGQVAVWSNGYTNFDGTISAKGGERGGNGGYVETSSGGSLGIGMAALVDTSAPKGMSGEWLLDPDNVTIVNGADSGADPDNQVDGSGTLTFGHDSGSNVDIDNGAINAGLGHGNVTIEAGNNITQNAGAPITAAGTGSLTLDAGNSITLNDNITLAGGSFSAFVNDGTSSNTDATARTAGAGSFAQAAGKTIDVSAGANAGVTIEVMNSSTGNFAPGSITLGGIKTGSSGALAVDGDATSITQSADGLTVGGTSTLESTDTSGATITLNASANALTGTVTLQADSAGTTVNLADSQSLTINTLGSGTMGAVTLSAPSVAFGPFTTSSNLTATASGAGGTITQSDVLSVSGTASFTTDGTGAITLKDAGNNLVGNVALSAGGAASVTNNIALGVGGTVATTATLLAPSINFGVFSAGSLGATATNGGITQTAADALTVTGTSSLTGSEGITLGNGSNDLAGEVTLEASGTSAASITNSVALSVDGIVGGLATLKAPSINFETLTAGTLAATATTGGITQTAGDELQVAGASSLTDSTSDQSITLTNTNNALSGAVTLTTSGATGNVGLTNSVATILDASSVGGTLTVSTGANPLTLNGLTAGGLDVSGVTGAVTLDTGTYTIGTVSQSFGAVTTNGTLTLGLPTTFTGVVTLGSATIFDSSSANGAVTFDDAVTGAGRALTVKAGSGNVAFDSAVGASGAGVGAFGVTTTGATTLAGNVYAASLDIAGPTTIAIGAGNTLDVFTDAADTRRGSDGAITFGGNISAAGQGLAADAGGNTLTLAGITAAGLSPTGGALVLNSGTYALGADGSSAALVVPITLNGNIVFGDAWTLGPTLTLGSDTTLSGATAADSITLDGTLNGAHKLTVNGSQTATVNGAVGAIMPLTSVSIAGPLNLNGNVITTGTQTYSGTVTVGANVALTTTNSLVDFKSTVNDATANTDGLSIEAGTGGVTFGAAVGGIRPLATLDTAGTTGTNTLDGNVHTSGVQTYGGPVTLGGDDDLTGTTVTFDGSVGGAHALTVTGGGAFDGAVNIASLDVTGTSALNGGAVTTTTTQTYGGAVTLGANTNLTDTTATFDSTVGGAYALTVTGNGVIDGAVTVASLDVTGTSALNANVTTATTQTYTGAVTIGGNITLKTTNRLVDFGGTVDDATANTHTLTIDSGSGGVTFGNAVGNTRALAGLDTTGTSGTIAVDGNVTTGGPQSYGGAVVLSAATTTFDTTDGGGVPAGDNVTFVNTVNGTTAGAQALTVKAGTGGVVAFDGSVGDTQALGTLTLTDATLHIAPDVEVTTQGGAFSQTGATVLLGAVATGTTIDTTNGGAAGAGANITFDGTINGTTAGDQALSLTAGTGGTVALEGNLGTTKALGPLNFDDATLDISPNVNVTTQGGPFTQTGATVLLGGAASRTTIDTTNGAAVAAGASVTFENSISGTTAGDQALTVNAGRGDVTFASMVGASGTGMGAFNVTTTGTTELSGNIWAASVNIAGPTSLGNSVTVFTDAANTGAGADGAITFGGNIAGGANTLALNSGVGAITLNGITASGLTLTTTGLETINAGTYDVDGGTVFNSTGGVDLDGAITLDNPTTFGSGTSAVTLTADTALTGGSASDNIVFGGTLDAASAGGESLTTAADGMVTFRGLVGNGFALSSLMTKGSSAPGSGTTDLNIAAAGTQVKTTGSQSYDNAVVLSDATKLSSTGGDITFDSTIDNATTTAEALELSVGTSGTAKFEAPVGGNATNGPLASLTVDADGTTDFNIAAAGTQVQTTGNQIYNNAVVLSDATKLSSTGGNITFVSTIDNATTTAEALELSVGTSGTAKFEGLVGGNATNGPLASLTVDANGTMDFNIAAAGTQVQTTGSQTFNNAVVLSDATKLSSSGGNITFASTIDNATPTAEALELSVGTSGTAKFEGLVGGNVTNGPLASLAVDANGTTDLNIAAAGTQIQTTGSQTYNNAVVLTDNTKLQSTSNGTITFGSTLDDSSAYAHALTIAAGTGNVDFDGRVGANNPTSGGTAAGTTPGAVTISSAGAVNINIPLDAPNDNGFHVGSFTATAGSLNAPSSYISTFDPTAAGGAVDVTTTGNVEVGYDIYTGGGLNGTIGGKGGNVTIQAGGTVQVGDQLTLTTMGSGDSLAPTLTSIGIDADGYSTGVLASTPNQTAGQGGTILVEGTNITLPFGAYAAGGAAIVDAAAAAAGGNAGSVTLTATTGNVTVGSLANGNIIGIDATGGSASGLGGGGGTVSISGARIALSTVNARGGDTEETTAADAGSGGGITLSASAATGAAVTLYGESDDPLTATPGIVTLGTRGGKDGASSDGSTFSLSGGTIAGQAGNILVQGTGGGALKGSSDIQLVANGANASVNGGPTVYLLAAGGPGTLSGSITLNGPIDGDSSKSEALRIQGGTIALPSVGATTPIDFISVTGTNIELNGNVTTGSVACTGAECSDPNWNPGQIIFNGPVVLEQNILVSNIPTNGMAPGNVTFVGSQTTVDDTTAAGDQSLTVQTDGTTTFNGLVGHNLALKSVLTEGYSAPQNGATDLNILPANAISVTTTGGQGYDNAVTLSENTVLASTGGGNITFGVSAGVGGTVDAATAGGQSLQTETDGTATFYGLVGHNAALASLATEGVTHAQTGTTDLNILPGNAIQVTTTGGQGYDNAVTLSESEVLASTGGGNITFGVSAGVGGTVDAATAGGQSLQTETDGTATFYGLVGHNAALASLATEGVTHAQTGTTDLNILPANAVSVTTTGGQSYDNTVTLSESEVLASTGGGNITFGVSAGVGGTVDAATAGGQSLQTETDGTATFFGEVGNNAELASLTTEGVTHPQTGTTDINGGVVDTTGPQTFDNALVLSATATLTSSNSGNVTFGSTVTAPFTMTVMTGGTTDFEGNANFSNQINVPDGIIENSGTSTFVVGTLPGGLLTNAGNLSNVTVGGLTSQTASEGFELSTPTGSLHINGFLAQDYRTTLKIGFSLQERAIVGLAAVLGLVNDLENQINRGGTGETAAQAAFEQRVYKADYAVDPFALKYNILGLGGSDVPGFNDISYVLDGFWQNLIKKQP